MPFHRHWSPIGDDSALMPSFKAKFHYAILVADRSEDGRRLASSC